MQLKFSIKTLFIAIAFTSCSKESEPAEVVKPVQVTPVTPDEINNFVWKAMNSWYYWQPNVANLADSKITSNATYTSLINGKTPDALFYSLLYQRSTDDEFSWIENNSEVVNSSKIAEVHKETGLNLTLLPKAETGINSMGLVNYVVPGSSAALAGLKRGDVITKVNGNQLTSNNLIQLFDKQVVLTLAATVKFANTEFLTTDKPTTITVVETEIDENPVAYYEKKVYGNKNIGYLVYNGFKSDYNDELNAAFAKMKEDGINELILDLRYNGGGSLETALGLAQMINGNFTGKPYSFLDFNNKHNSEDGFDYLSDKLHIYNLVDNKPTYQRQENVNSLGLTKIYVLVGLKTASASELTVQCLKKYISITTIGWETRGKFVGSITLYDSPNNNYTSYANRSTKHKWQMQPICFAYYNKDRDTNPSAIMPDQRISPYFAFNNIAEFGNTKDPELKKAIELITGLTLRTTTKTSSININTNNLSSLNAINDSRGLYIEDFKSRK